MIRPEVWARISGTTCEHIRYAPCRHPSICALNSSQSPPAKVERRRGSKEKRPKALFTKMSTPPNESTAVPTSLEDCDSSQTSACTAIAKPPSEWMSSTVRCALAASCTLLMTTAAPCDSRHFYTAAPMPLPEPVMIAVLPSRFTIGRRAISLCSVITLAFRPATSLCCPQQHRPIPYPYRTNRCTRRCRVRHPPRATDR